MQQIDHTQGNISKLCTTYDVYMATGHTNTTINNIIIKDYHIRQKLYNINGAIMFLLTYS